MDLPLAQEDVLRLEPAGTVLLGIKGTPYIRLRRPTIGEMMRAMDRWEEIRLEIDARTGPDGGKLPEYSKWILGPRWMCDVIATLTDQQVICEADDMPAWMGAGVGVLRKMTDHWLEIPLASGVSELGSPPNGNGAANLPTRPEPRIIGQAILGEPVAGSSPSTG